MLQNTWICTVINNLLETTAPQQVMVRTFSKLQMFVIRVFFPTNRKVSLSNTITSAIEQVQALAGISISLHTCVLL